jgi:hypothetical protein
MPGRGCRAGRRDGCCREGCRWRRWLGAQMASIGEGVPVVSGWRRWLGAEMASIGEGCRW